MSKRNRSNTWQAAQDVKIKRSFSFATIIVLILSTLLLWTSQGLAHNQATPTPSGLQVGSPPTPTPLPTPTPTIDPSTIHSLGNAQVGWHVDWDRSWQSVDFITNFFLYTHGHNYLEQPYGVPESWITGVHLQKDQWDVFVVDSFMPRQAVETGQIRDWFMYTTFGACLAITGLYDQNSEPLEGKSTQEWWKLVGVNGLNTNEDCFLATQWDTMDISTRTVIAEKNIRILNEEIPGSIFVQAITGTQNTILMFAFGPSVPELNDALPELQPLIDSMVTWNQYMATPTAQKPQSGSDSTTSAERGQDDTTSQAQAGDDDDAEGTAGRATFTNETYGWQFTYDPATYQVAASEPEHIALRPSESNLENWFFGLSTVDADHPFPAAKTTVVPFTVDNCLDEPVAMNGWSPSDDPQTERFNIRTETMVLHVYRGSAPVWAVAGCFILVPGEAVLVLEGSTLDKGHNEALFQELDAILAGISGLPS